MILSKKKIDYLREVRDNNLLDKMKKYKMLEDLKQYGISIDENSEVASDEIRDIYNILINRVLSKYGEG